MHFKRDKERGEKENKRRDYLIKGLYTIFRWKDSVGYPLHRCIYIKKTSTV